MSTNEQKSAAVEAVELHYYRHEGTSAFLVVIPDNALVKLNEGSPIRGLTIAFNSMGKKSKRIAALAEAVKEAEGAGIVKADEKPPGWLRRQWRKVAFWVVAVVYPAVRLCKGEKDGVSL